jgi:hypothetical protein
MNQLSLSDLGTGGEYVPLSLDPGLETAYRRATGWAGAYAPVGMAAVIGRHAYIQGKVMPPGGILRSLRVTSLREADYTGEYLTRVDASVVSSTGSRRRVRIATVLADRNGVDFARADYFLNWPKGES